MQRYVSLQVDKVYELSRDFFRLPQEVKSKYKKVDLPNNFHGYAGPGDEL
jgi:isopenicillin N synthase-like dioxygenase